MGLFDRLLRTGSGGAKAKPVSAGPEPRKEAETFFLDPDASSSLGDVNYMRRPNKIRRTFPGNADNPGEKEMVQEVDSMGARVEKLTAGLPGTEPRSTDVSLTGGIPQQVKKTFAEKMSAGELEQRLKGSALTGVNVPGAPANPRRADAAASGSGDQPQIAQKGLAAKPGAIDPFKQMVKDLNG